MDNFYLPDSYYDPPEEREEEPEDDGDYAYDRWRDEQMEEGDDDDFDPALDY